MHLQGTGSDAKAALVPFFPLFFYTTPGQAAVSASPDFIFFLSYPTNLLTAMNPALEPQDVDKQTCSLLSRLAHGYSTPLPFPSFPAWDSAVSPRSGLGQYPTILHKSHLTKFLRDRLSARRSRRKVLSDLHLSLPENCITNA